MTDRNPLTSRAAPSTTGGVPIAPSLGATLENANVRPSPRLADRRVVFVSALAVVLGVAAAFVARALVHVIALVTNLAFYGRLSLEDASPANAHVGLLVLVIPALGGVIVGVMARFGSKAIRGHGIPEAMERVLTGQSRIPARLTFLKPLSAAVAIGTGGPFGAEGPIIATGGALGSLLGQLLETTAQERKALLAAGSAAGMAATFGTPVAAVLLAVELLLFELRPRSLIPVALAATAATGTRYALVGGEPVFAMPGLGWPSGGALVAYVLLGLALGVVAVGVTRAVYAVEDRFEKLPVDWMWWPALGGLVVGAVGLVAPRTLGVGYDNIVGILGGSLAGRTLALLAALKFVSWVVALGSGTSGGTLAPIFTFGGGLGALAGAGLAALLPGLGVDPRLAALVGMAALFAGASRAFLASVVFAFETTRQAPGLVPLLGGCAGAYLVSALLMRHTIMTEKIARRGVRIPEEYAADFLASVHVREAAKPPVTLRADDLVSAVRAWLATNARDAAHQGYPVVDGAGLLVGVLTRRDLLAPAADPEAAVRSLVKRPPSAIFDDSSLREAADLMLDLDVGRLPVVTRAEPRRPVGILTRSDLLGAHRRRLDEERRAHRTLRVRLPTGSAD